MTTIGGHYVPVAAKRRALEIYRDRRRGGGNPLDPCPVDPYTAMRSTVDFFAGHYAVRMAHGDRRNDAQELLDGYRAAEHYMNRLVALRWRSWPLRQPHVPLPGRSERLAESA